MYGLTLGCTTVPPTKKPYVYSQSRTLGNTAYMVGFQIFPRSHPDYVFVTKIPRMLILYITFLKNKDNSPLNNTVVIESALYGFLFSLNVSYCFWPIVLLTYRGQAAAHICTIAHICTLYSTKAIRMCFCTETVDTSCYPSLNLFPPYPCRTPSVRTALLFTSQTL